MFANRGDERSSDTSTHLRFASKLAPTDRCSTAPAGAVSTTENLQPHALNSAGTACLSRERGARRVLVREPRPRCSPEQLTSRYYRYVQRRG